MVASQCPAGLILAAPGFIISSFYEIQQFLCLEDRVGGHPCARHADSARDDRRAGQ